MVESRSGGLTVNGFVAKWAVMAAAAPRKTLAHLLYLGYEEDPNALFHIARPRRQERKADQPARGVYQVRALTTSFTKTPVTQPQGACHTCAVRNTDLCGDATATTVRCFKQLVSGSCTAGVTDAEEQPHRCQSQVRLNTKHAGCAQCLVFGAVGVGKSTLLAGLAGQQSPSGPPGAAGSGAGGQFRPTAAGRVEVGGEHGPFHPVISPRWWYSSHKENLVHRTLRSRCRYCGISHIQESL